MLLFFSRVRMDFHGKGQAMVAPSITPALARTSISARS